MQMTEELPHVTLDSGVREAEMQIGDDVAWWREHALILAEHSQLYKGRLPVQSSRSIDMTSDSESTLRPAHDLELRVRYAETDQMGVVYHANYLVWCEMGRTDFIRRCGRSYADLERDGISLAVSELSARYHAAARYDDLIRVRTSLGEVRSRMISFDYLISDATTDKRLVSAHTTLICLDGNGRPVALPSELRQLLR
jgi:acyl-CoA thioester hydrolase